ncbi:MAG: gliding motility-associated C-terminal domain-containing protein [Saprospiraceae bacterium]|nr:gliding motility-associated C-terminal domain-containing protein [Saprospiraceae bacterium]
MKYLSLILSLVFSINSGICQFLEIEETGTLNFSLCRENRIRLSLKNNSPNQLNDIRLKAFFPSGLEYVPGTVSLASEFNLNTLHTPEFMISSINPGTSIEISMILQAQCQLYDLVNMGLLFNNQWIAEYNFGQDSIIGVSYSINTGFLVISNVPSIRKEAGSQFTRQITITNSRLGPVSSFYFEDVHDPLEILSNSGTTLVQNDTSLRLEIKAEHLLNIGDRDSLFEEGESIVITEMINHKTCLNELINSKFRVFWGCDSNICQSYLEASQIDFTLPSSQALLDFDPKPKFPECICDPDGATQEFVIYNNGGAVAENLMVSFKASTALSSFDVAFLKNSFRIVGQGQIISIDYINQVTGTYCLFDSAFHEVKITLANLNPSGQIRILFDYVTCKSIQPEIATNFPYFYSFSYNSVCVPNSTRSGNERAINNFSKASSARIGLRLSPVESPLMDQKIYDAISSIGFNEAISNRNLSIRYTIPCPFELIDTSFLLLGKNAIVRNIDFSYPIIVDLEYLPPFPKDFTFQFPLKLNCEHFCLDSIEAAEIKLLSSCPREQDIRADMLVKICAQVNLSCENTIYKCGANSLSDPGFELACINRSQTTDSIPAYILFEDSLFRKNMGTSDFDNDRFENTGSNDLTQAKLKNFVTGDTIVVEFAGTVAIDNENLQYDSLTIVMTSELSYSYATSYIDIVDKSSGIKYSLEYPVLDTFSSINPLANCAKPIIQTNPLGKGFKIPIVPEEIIKYKSDFPPNFVFEQGDSIYCRFEARISSFTNQRIAALPVIKRMALNSRQIPSEYLYSCLVDVDTVLLTSVGLLRIPPSPVQYICADQVRLSTQIIRLNPNTNNFFTHEYRPLVKIDSIYLTGLSGLRYIGIELALYYQSDTGTVLYRLDTIPVRSLSPTLFYLSESELQPYIFDESYELRITPLAILENCLEASGNITTSVFYSGPNHGLFFIDQFFNTFYNSHVSTINSSIQIQNANQFVSQSTKTIFAFGNNIQWTLNLGAQSGSGYFYFDIWSVRNSIQSLQLKVNPDIPIVQISDKRFRIGSFKALTAYSIDFLADILSCDQDTIYISSLWVCDDSEQAEINKCNLDTFSVYILPEDPELELDLMQESSLNKLCDTLPEILVRLYNADRGTAREVYLDMELPSGISWLPGSLYFSYPAGSPYRPLPNPTLIGINIYRWNIEDLDPVLKQNGLKGVFSDPENTILFKLSAFTNCDLMINGSINAMTSGKNTCGIIQNTITKTGPTIKIEGAETNKELSIQLSENVKSLCADTSEILVQLIPAYKPDIRDTLVIRIPSFLEYISGSIINLSNHNIQEALIIDSSNYSILKFGLGQLGQAGQAIRFSIKITGIRSIYCTQTGIDAFSYFQTSLFCQADQTHCNVFIQTGSTSLELKRDLPEINIHGFEISPGTDPHKTKLKFEIEVLHFDKIEDDKICFYLIGDKDANSNWNHEDSVLTTICIPKQELARNGIHSFELELDLLTLISCSYLLAVSENTCICGLDTLAFQISSGIHQVYYDSICTGVQMTIGVNDIPEYKYKWFSADFSCDSCSSQFIKLNNPSDSIVQFKYVLTEFLDSLCQNTYEYHILVFPKQNGTKTIHTVCPGEMVSLSANNQKNFIWSGSGITNPNAPNQNFTLTDSMEVYLSYEDEKGCPILDTFCLFPLHGDFNFTISRDTTILARSKVILCASGGKSYKWSPAAGLVCPDCPCIEVSPDQNTRYTVTIIDSLDCPHELGVDIFVIGTVCDSTDVFIPNAFSPNEDQKNDVLYVLSNQTLLQIHLVIYNRWGEKVFETFNIKHGWDGTYNGEKLSPDVYGYYLEVWCPDRPKFTKKGNINLLK